MCIDWNEAPEWAVGHGEVTCITTKKIWFNDLVYMYVGDSRSYTWSGADPELAHNHSRRSIKNVTMRPTPWTGAGLPPVGTVCEFMKHNSPPAPEGQWTVGTIRYVSDYTVIIGGDKCENVHHPRNCSFRPIRTPEQIAAEEREKVVEEMMLATSSLGHSDVSKRILCRELVAAGFSRKQTTDQ